MYLYIGKHITSWRARRWRNSRRGHINVVLPSRTRARALTENKLWEAREIHRLGESLERRGSDCSFASFSLIFDPFSLDQTKKCLIFLMLGCVVVSDRLLRPSLGSITGRWRRGTYGAESFAVIQIMGNDLAIAASASSSRDSRVKVGSWSGFTDPRGFFLLGFTGLCSCYL